MPQKEAFFFAAQTAPLFAMTEAVATSKEGKVTFKHSSLPYDCETWYKVYGDLKSSSTSRPLIILHGGPGACHNYLLALKAFASSHHLPVVFYDQLGNGNSTHLREKRLDTAFWTPELFMDELQNLLDHLDITEYDVLGQSWGGMFAAMWAVRNPKGLNKVVISNSPTSMDLWVKSCKSLREKLPKEIDDALEKHEQAQTYDEQEYKDAVQFFYKRHLCRVSNEKGEFPKDVQDSLDWIDKDDTVYFTMNGPSEFTVIGSLKTWSIIPDLPKIHNKCLILTAEHDEAQEVCLEPWSKIPHSTRHHFEGGSHMTHVEMTDRYMEVVMEFLKS